MEGELKIGAVIEIGNIFLSRGEYDSALYYFSISDDDRLLFLKGITYYKMGRYQDVISTCEKILKDKKEKEIIQKTKLLLGDTYLEREEYEKAISYYKDVLNEEKEELRRSALEGLGWAYFGIKDYNSAFHYLDRLSSEFPEYQGKGKIFLTMGDIAYSMKDFKRAKEYYGKVKGEYEPEGIYKKGLVLFDSGDFIEATKTFSELRKKFPLYEKSDDAFYLIALCLRKSGDLFASINNLRELLKLSISKEIRKKATLLLADNFFDQERYDSSMYYYERYTYIFSAPEKDILPGIRGVIYSVYKLRGEKDFENLVNDYMRKYKGIEFYYDLSLMIAGVYFNIGNSKKAVEILEGLKTIEAKIALLDVYKRMKEEDKVLKILNDLLMDEKTKEKACFELSNYYYSKKDYSKSIEYSKSINKPDFNFFYIMSLIESKKLEEALKEVENRNTGEFYDVLKGIILLRKDDEKGIELLEKGMKNERIKDLCMFEMAKYLYSKGREEKAKELLLRIKYLYSESNYYSPSMILLSKILIKEGKKEDARKILEDVIGRKDGYEKDAKSNLDSIR